jgi:hypothetical protein
LEQRWPLTDGGTKISLIDTTYDNWIVGLNATVSTHPYLADRRWRIEVVHDDGEFNATFGSSDER